MRRETAAGNITLSELAAGNALAFVSLHLAGMLSIVVNLSPTNPAQGVPETMSFDIHRFNNLYYHLNRIVSGITLVVLAQHALIGGDRQPSQEKRSVLIELADIFANDDSVFACDFGFVAEKLGLKLDSVGLLADEGARAAFLSTLEGGFTDMNHRVRLLM